MPFDVLQRRMFKMESLEHPPLSVFIKEFSEPQSCGQVQNILMSFVGGLIFVSASGSRCNRLCSQIRSRLLPDSVASAPRFGRVCSLMRMRLLPRSLPSLRIGLREWGERGRECGWRFKCLLRVRGPHFASKVSYRAGAAGWGQNRNIKGEGERRLCRWGRRKAACRRGGEGGYAARGVSDCLT